MIRPPRLRPGDTIAAVSLSWGGAATYPHRYAAGKRQLEAEFGVRVVEARHALRDANWLDLNPSARAEDLMDAFADPDIRGIVSIIGGDDSIRILPHLDIDVIRDNPKVFMGYSDTTVTHFACRKAGLVSFYGPAIMAGFGESGGIPPYLADSVRWTLFEPTPPGQILPNLGGWTAEFQDWSDPACQTRRRTLRPSPGWRWLQGKGTVRGPLIGGCAEVLEWLKGTPVWPEPEQWDGAILFLETSEEAPSAVALIRWLRSYGAMGILHRICGILLGRPGGPDLPLSKHKDYDTALLRVVADELELTSLPIVTGMDFGHTDPFFVLPYGVTAEIDCTARKFSIVESAVA